MGLAGEGKALTEGRRRAEVQWNHPHQWPAPPEERPAREGQRDRRTDRRRGLTEPVPLPWSPRPSDNAHRQKAFNPHAHQVRRTGRIFKENILLVNWYRFLPCAAILLTLGRMWAFVVVVFFYQNKQVVIILQLTKNKGVQGLGDRIPALSLALRL